MHFQQLISAARSLAPPKPFRHSRDEAAFQAEFIRTGYGFAVAITLAGTLISLAFIVLSKLSPAEASDSFGLNVLRSVVGLACALSFFSLLSDPGRALRNYLLTIFFPTATTLLGIGLLLTISRQDVLSQHALAQSTLALVIAAWMISAFCRLPLRQIIWMTSIASLANLWGLALYSPQQLPVMGIFLLLANLIAWSLSIHIEKRERVIWHQATRNRNAIRKAKHSVNRATVINTAQARLIRSVGHDIRQPLSSSGIYLGVVTRAAKQSADEVMEQNLARVKTCLRSVEGTLDRLLEIPSENDETNLETDRTNLARMFQDLRDIFEPQADRMGVTLRFTLSCETPLPVRTNERAMREVLSNILANALKYSAINAKRSTPSVVVGVVRFREMVRVDIIDNGVGIPSELHTRVFDEYYRAPSNATQVKGSGLGLAIVESMVQRLPDHRLRLRSCEAKGTRVKIYLPSA